MTNSQIVDKSGVLVVPKLESPEPCSITITEDDDGFYTARAGERYQDKLCREEALWCVVQFLTGTTGFLKTQAEHDEINATYGIKPRLQAWEKQLGLESK